MSSAARSEPIFQGVPWRRWVKNRRKALGITQAQLARQLHYSTEMISHVERGRDRPSPDLAALLADILEVPAAERPEFIRMARGAVEPLAEKTPQPPPALHIPGSPITPLIGRADDLDAVQRLLTQVRHQLVTITGLPGVGKTRLAIAVAQRVQAVYPHGVVWVALAPLCEPLLALGAVAQALKIRETGSHSLQDALRATLWDRQLLLVLDNCEQIQDISSLISVLLDVPGVQILATSRKRLRIRGAQHFQLAPLPVPGAELLLHVDELRANPALALFVARAQETAPGFTLDRNNAAAIRQICAALDGLPLALELAAVRIRVLPPAAMLARLHQRLTWLVGGPEDLPPHQQTLAGALAWSYNLLSSAQQRLFRHLSVFAGGFTLTAALAVCGPWAEPDDDLLSAITDLDEWNLLYPVGEMATPRYDMREMIREYGANCLATQNEEVQLRHAHLMFYLDLAEQARTMGGRADTGAWFDQLAEEQANFRAALNWGLSPQGDHAAAARLGVALGWFWDTCGYWHQGRHWLTRLLAQGDLPADRIAAQVRYYAGRFAYLQGDYAAAGQLLEESLVLSQAYEDLTTQISALNSLGWIAYSESAYRRAQHFYNQSLRLCRALDDPLATATVLNILGGIDVTLGEQTTAERLLHESLMLRQQAGDQQGIARSLNVLGLAAHQQGESVRARKFFMESADLFRATGDKLGMALAVNNLGWAAFTAGQSAAAQTWLEEALERAREVGNIWCIIWALCYLAWVALEQKNCAKAAPLFQQSLNLAQAQGCREVLILIYSGQGHLARAVNDSAQVVAYLQLIEDVRQGLGIPLTPFERQAIEQLRQGVAGSGLP